jgi:hypothetical protein
MASLIPGFAHTAYADDEAKIIEEGFKGFISKPFVRHRLVSMINELL